jgi:hypothetical protein
VDLRPPGTTDFRPAAEGATDFREVGGGATDFREALAFADDLSLFLGMAAASDPLTFADRFLTREAYYTCESFPNFDELALQRRTPK